MILIPEGAIAKQRPGTVGGTGTGTVRDPDLEAVVNKPYQGSAPFGSQSHRFDVAGVHPNLKMPGSFTECAYDRKTLSPVVRQLGPGRYSMDSKRSSSADPGPGWERALEVARLAQIPHLLYRETWEREKMAKLNLGPGRYNSKDFIQDLSERVHTARGLLEMYEGRFKSKERFNTPGPGSYGKDGVPHKTFEDSKDKSKGKVSLLDWGKNIDRSLPLTGSTVAPGTYEHQSAIDQVTQGQVGQRGPYDVFSGARSAPITVGHWAQPKPVKNRGPGDYEKKTFVDDLSYTKVAHKGIFKKLPQYPEIPGERIFYTTPAQAPVEKTRPGPGYYEKTSPRKPSTESMPPFMHNAERFDERARNLMMGAGAKTVGIGRYDVAKQEKFFSRNGARSVFESRVPILLDPPKDKIHKERLKPHVPSARKRVLRPQAREFEDLHLTRKVLNQSVDRLS